MPPPPFHSLPYLEYSTVLWVSPETRQLPLFLRLPPASNPQLPQLPLIHRRWSLAHQIRSASCFREWNDVADRGLACKDHHHAVDAQCDSTVRRRSILQRIEQEAKSPLSLLIAHPERRENLRLHVAPVNTNRPRP